MTMKSLLIFGLGTLLTIGGGAGAAPATGTVYRAVMVDTNTGVVVAPTNLAAANGWLTNAGAFVSSSGGTYYNGTYSFQATGLTNWDGGDYGTARGGLTWSAGGYNVPDALHVWGPKLVVNPAFTRDSDNESYGPTVIDSGSVRIYGGDISGGGATNRPYIYVGDGYSTIGLETNIGVRGGITISGDYLKFNGADVVTTAGGWSGSWTSVVDGVTNVLQFNNGVATNKLTL